MHAIPELIRTVLSFGVVLGVLVFVHEFGHYLAARLCGVHVEVFSIGFGQAITRWVDRQGTVWKIAWLPLGGYVKLHGQERPEDVSAAVRASWIPGRTFHEKSVGKRAIVVAAGPIANFVLAIVLFSGLFAVLGRPVTQPVVGAVMHDSAADHAGLATGDRIVTIDGQPIHNFEDIQRIVSAHPDTALPVTYDHGGTQRSVQVHVGHQVEDGHEVGLLGIQAGKVDYQPVALPIALWGGVLQTWDITSQTIVGVEQMITGQRGTSDLGGPLRIAELSGQVAELGLASMIQFIGILSINLGLINLFPIPVLDGGHLMFYFAEAVRGRPIPARAQEYGFRAGIALLAGLFVFATWNDLSNIGLFHWVASLMG
ncbi:MAG TPA: RIP metalloprotease RseP [Acetobacteraceae bacterium]